MPKLLRELLVSLYLRAKALLTTQFTHIILFLTVNVVLGALGFLVPIAIEYAATDSFLPALRKQLDAAGAYTFAIAFLASCISLVAAEYLDRKEVAQYRHPKVLLSVLACLIMVFCAVFSGSQTARSLIGDQPPAQVSQNPRLTERPNTSAAELYDSGSLLKVNAKDGGKPGLSTLDILQIRITIVAVVVGLLLFLVFQYQAPSMQDQVAKYMQKTEADAGSLMDGLQIRKR